MTSEPLAYQTLPDVDDLEDDVDREADAFNPIRGILLAVALCAPFWVAVVFWMIRSL